jgi:hypothetical protein
VAWLWIAPQGGRSFPLVVQLRLPPLLSPLFVKLSALEET